MVCLGGGPIYSKSTVRGTPIWAREEADVCVRFLAEW